MQRTILIVEDESLTRELLRLMLEPAGFQIIEAEGGRAGLKKATEQKPDVVILDLMLPDIDGLEVCRTLRGRPETADLPIIILTVRTGLQAVEAGLKAGANKYMVKPILRDELIRAIHEILAAP